MATRKYAKPKPARKAAARDFRVMSGGEYRRILKALRMTQEGAGAFFGAHPQSGLRWAADGPPAAVAMMLRLMEAYEIDGREVETVLRHHTEEVAERLSSATTG